MVKQNLLTKVLLLFALIVGSSSMAWADIISPWSHTFSTTDKTFTGDGTENLSGVDWTLAVTWADDTKQDYNVDTTYGMKIGSNSKVPNSMTLSTSDFTGTIKKVHVTTHGRSKSTCTVGVKVGDSDFTTTDSWGGSTSTEMTFTGSATGEIIITWTQGSSNKGAFYVTKIEVEFEAASTGSEASTPSFNPVSGTELTKAQNITVSSANAVKIIYTTNGDDPTIGGTTTSTINAASGNVMIAGTGTITVKAKGVDSNDQLSALGAANYTIKPTAPLILPENRKYTGSTDVSFTQADNIDVYYTQDGTDPTSNSTKYDGTPFTITTNITIKAIAIDTYGNMSDITTAKFLNSELQETDFSITLNNAFFGSTGTSNIDDAELSGEDYNVTVTIKRNQSDGGNKLYVNATQIRLYQYNTMTVSAPAGYNLTSIVFIEPSSGASWAGSGNTSSPEGYDDSEKTWTGSADEVTITFGGTCRMAGLNITLARDEVTINPAKQYVSFCSAKALDFTNVEGLTAFVVSGETSTSVTLSSVNKVPANTGLVLKKTGTKTSYTVPVLTGNTDTFTNLLEATGTNGVTVDANSVYVLSDGQFKLYTGTSIAGGKAYLPKTEGAPSLDLDFGEGTTGVQIIERTVNDNQYYTLDGRRVAEPTKGLYIINGKKVVIK